MRIELQNETGQVLNAKVEVGAGEIIVHSRGGAFGKPNLRNPDYRKAVRLILERLKASGWGITGVWLDSSVVQDWPIADRCVLRPEEFNQDVEALVTLIGQRGAAAGRPLGSGGHGNSTKRIKIGVSEQAVSKITMMLKSTAASVSKRLAASTLREVTASDIDAAIDLYIGGAEHNFSCSSDYDLVLPDGQLAPPKAIFGLALRRVIGRPATPDDFSAGWNTPCFELLEGAGYPIIEKGTLAVSYEAPQLPPDDEAEWAEGSQARVTHLTRERARGLAPAKRRAFMAKHGRLFCERCLLVPSESLGIHGNACIEVHHADTAVAFMEKGHVTRLKDLQCLCANCHRIVHRELAQFKN